MRYQMQKTHGKQKSSPESGDVIHCLGGKAAFCQKWQPAQQNADNNYYVYYCYRHCYVILIAKNSLNLIKQTLPVDRHHTHRFAHNAAGKVGVVEQSFYRQTH